MTLALVLSCSIENSIHEPGQDVTEPVTFAPTVEYPNVSMSLDVALQRMSWGENVSRCQIQIAFHKLAEGEGPANDPGEHESGGDNIIDIPEDPGTCIYSPLNLEGENAPPTEEGNHDDGTDPNDDNWQEAGDLSAAPEIYLHSAERTITLHQQPLEDGRVRYEWDGCDPDTFPFGEVFDVEVPNHDGDDSLPGFYVVEAFGVGPDMLLAEPIPNDAFRLNVRNDEDIWAAWTHDGDAPLVRGQPMERDVKLFIRNYQWTSEGGTPEFEALACDPPGDWSEVRTEDLQLLVPNVTDVAPESPYYAAFQVDAHYDSPQVELPWGQTLKVRSTVTEGGTMHLWEDIEGQ